MSQQEHHKEWILISSCILTMILMGKPPYGSTLTLEIKGLGSSLHPQFLYQFSNLKEVIYPKCLSFWISRMENNETRDQ